MAKVDRLGWTAGLAFTAYGASVGIRTNDPVALEQIYDYMPPEWESTTEPIVDNLFSIRVAPPAKSKGRRNYNLLYSEATLVKRTLDLEPIYEPLENLLRLTVAFRANQDYLFVHAGVVGWQGKAIVIPGRSFSGKTTLVSELIKAGAIYYSDDMAVFDREGRVHPYPVPLSVREPDGRCRVDPKALGSNIGEKPLPVGLVVVTKYEDGARWQPRRITPGRSLMALLDNTVAARKDPTTSLPILQHVVTEATTVQSKRGEASTVAKRILQQLDSI